VSMARYKITIESWDDYGDEVECHNVTIRESTCFCECLRASLEAASDDIPGGVVEHIAQMLADGCFDNANSDTTFAEDELRSAASALIERIKEYRASAQGGSP
jgi:hypothetical protein